MRLFSSASDKKLAASLKNLLGFMPSNLLLYKQAFRHKSVASTIKEGVKNSNERLEFLGDAIIGAVIADFLFKKFPFKDEGFLTKMRSRIVSRNTFNQLSRKLGIDAYLEINSDMQKNIGSSVNGDALEAFIGAIYLDKGYKKTAEFIINKIVKLHLDVDEIAVTDKDFKSKIIEYVQREKKQLKFDVVDEGGKQRLYTINLEIDGTVLSSGKGLSKKQAEQTASELLCIQLGIE